MPRTTAVVRLFGVSPRTLNNWIDKHGFPRPITVGTRQFFERAEIMAFMERQREGGAA
jgi:predicted DNA-binding transcriptional regulator AlpA